MIEICDLSNVLKRNGNGCPVRVCGWVHKYRDQKNIQFITLRGGKGSTLGGMHGTSKVQVTIFKPVILKYQNILNQISIEACIDVVGKLNIDKRAPQGYEICCEEIVLIGKAESLKENVTEETARSIKCDKRHLYLRQDIPTMIMKIRHHLIKYMYEYLYKEGFYRIDPPQIIQQEVEGGSSLFKLKYFEKDAHLTQSSQLYSETMLATMGKVFADKDSFRAEKSMTRRHLAEFTHIEPEEAFLGCTSEAGFHKLLLRIEQFMIYVTTKLFEDEEAGPMIRALNPTFKPYTKSFKRMTYNEMIQFLKENNIYKDEEMKIYYKYGEDVPEKPEREMIDMIGEPVFLTNFPKTMKAFYMETDPNDTELTLSVDLLLPNVGEVVGGSMRLWRYDELMEGFKKEEMEIEKYQWYIDQRRYGSCPHGGFGIGTERLLMYITNADSVKECCLYPRFMGRCLP